MIASIGLMIVATVCSVGQPFLQSRAIGFLQTDTLDSIPLMVIGMIALGAIGPLCTRHRVRWMDAAGRRALATNRAEEPEKIRAYLAQQTANEEKKTQDAQRREAYLAGKSCLRCGATMVKMGARRFQMYEYESLTDSIFNPSADTLLLDVLFCQQCRKVEFFLPEEAGN